MIATPIPGLVKLTEFCNPAVDPGQRSDARASRLRCSSVAV